MDDGSRGADILRREEEEEEEAGGEGLFDNEHRCGLSHAAGEGGCKCMRLREDGLWIVRYCLQNSRQGSVGRKIHLVAELAEACGALTNR